MNAYKKVNCNKAFTLIEVVLVIVLIGIMAGFAASKFNALDSFRYKSSMRHFVNTWEFLAQEAKTKSEAYRLIINLENNSYAIRREVIPLAKNNSKVLEDFRLDSEKERLAQETERKLKEDQKKLAEEEAREGDLLENQFYQKIFFDPNVDVELIAPLDYPSLAREQFLENGISFKEIYIGGEKINEKEAIIRFSANGAIDFAYIHLKAGEVIYTAVINPATGKVKLYEKELDFNWRFKDK